MTVWGYDKTTGISYGVNDDGDLFLGDNNSGYNLPNTIGNRAYVKAEFERIIGKANRY